jgi:hypothetical protein
VNSASEWFQRYTLNLNRPGENAVLQWLANMAVERIVLINTERAFWADRNQINHNSIQFNDVYCILVRWGGEVSWKYGQSETNKTDMKTQETRRVFFIFARHYV